MQKPVVYLTNKDLLREIDASKRRYCWFEDRCFATYHVIVRSADEITPTLLAETVERIETARWSSLRKLHKGDPRYQASLTEAIAVGATPGFEPLRMEDVVVRIMRDDHVPRIVPVVKPASKASHSKSRTVLRTNFPPFVHVVRDGKGDLREVGRSHWRGDLASGEFCLTHGRITDALARMFLLLVERYGRRPNFRSYTWNEDMRSNALVQLTSAGLQFDESKGANPFAYYTSLVTNAFLRVLSLEKVVTGIRDDLLIMEGLTPSFGRQQEDFDAQRAATDLESGSLLPQAAPPKRPGRPRRSTGHSS